MAREPRENHAPSASLACAPGHFGASPCRAAGRRATTSRNQRGRALRDAANEVRNIAHAAVIDFLAAENGDRVHLEHFCSAKVDYQQVAFRVEIQAENRAA